MAFQTLRTILVKLGGPKVGNAISKEVHYFERKHQVLAIFEKDYDFSGVEWE